MTPGISQQPVVALPVLDVNTVNCEINCLDISITRSTLELIIVKSQAYYKMSVIEHLLLGPPATLYLLEKYSSVAVKVTVSFAVSPLFCLTLSVSVHDVLAIPTISIIIAATKHKRLLKYCNLMLPTQ